MDGFRVPTENKVSYLRFIMGLHKWQQKQEERVYKSVNFSKSQVSIFYYES
jgi:hypothetical protein